jgi:hypothetical protein
MAQHVPMWLCSQFAGFRSGRDRAVERSVMARDPEAHGGEFWDNRRQRLQQSVGASLMRRLLRGIGMDMDSYQWDNLRGHVFGLVLAEIRGPCSYISKSLPGIHVCAPPSMAHNI